MYIKKEEESIGKIKNLVESKIKNNNKFKHFKIDIFIMGWDGMDLGLEFKSYL